MLQAANEIAADKIVLYVSGEESARQIKMRSQRLVKPEGTETSSNNLFLVTETNLDTIIMHIEQVKPELVIIDSIQTIYFDSISSSSGSVSQVRECTSRLRELAKTSGIAVFLIGHVTKEGMIESLAGI